MIRKDKDYAYPTPFEAQGIVAGAFRLSAKGDIPEQPGVLTFQALGLLVNRRFNEVLEDPSDPGEVVPIPLQGAGQPWQLDCAFQEANRPLLPDDLSDTMPDNVYSFDRSASSAMGDAPTSA